MISIGFKVLDKKTNKNASEEFFKAMEEHYRGRNFRGPCTQVVATRSYRGGNILVSEEPFYNNRSTSVIINGDNNTEIFKIKSELEKEIEFKLKKVENGN